MATAFMRWMITEADGNGRERAHEDVDVNGRDNPRGTHDSSVSRLQAIRPRVVRPLRYHRAHQEGRVLLPDRAERRGEDDLPQARLPRRAAFAGSDPRRRAERDRDPGETDPGAA